MTKLPNPREIVQNKDTTVSNGIKGHQHRKKNELKKKYFEIHDLEIWKAQKRTQCFGSG